MGKIIAKATITISAIICFVLWFTLATSAEEPLSITTQPQSKTVASGTIVEFSVGTNTTGVTYEWYYNNPSTMGSDYKKSSVTTATYSVTADKTKHSAGFNVYCIVKKGAQSIKSNVAKLTLSDAETLSITTQPTSQTVASGTAVNFIVVANTTGVTYEWYYNNPATMGAEYKKSSVATATYSVTADKTKHSAGFNVYCVVKKGTQSVKSNVATLTLSDALSITTQPASQTVASGTAVNFTVVANTTGVTYEWYYNNPATMGAEYKKSSVATATYSVTADKTKHSAGFNVYCIVKKGTQSVKSNVATLTLSDALSITTQPASQTVASGTAVNFTVVANTTGVTYEWYYNNPATMGTDYKKSSVTTATYSVTADKTKHSAGFNVYCIVKKGTQSVKSNVAKLTISDAETLSITTQPTSQTVASGTAVNFTVVANTTGVTYEWYYNNPATMGAEYKKSSVATATYSVTADKTKHSAGFNVYCVVKKGTQSVKSNVATLTLSDELSITTQPASQTVASGTTVNFTVAANTTGVTYEWYYNNPATMGTDYKKSSVTTATYSITADETKHSAGYNVYCIVKKGTQSVKSNVATLTIKKNSVSITTDIKDQTVSTGETAEFVVVAKGSNLTYEWYYNNPATMGTDYKKSSVTSNKYSITADIAKHSAGYNVYCIVRDTATGDFVKTSIAKLTLNRVLSITTEPTSTLTFTSASESKTLTVAATGDGLTYQWQVKKAGSSSYTNCTNGTNYANATTATLTIKSQAAANNGDKYRCVVKDKYSQTKESKECTISCQFAINAAWSTGLVTTIEQGKEVSVTVQQPASGITVKFYLDNTLTSSNITNGIKFTATKAAGSKHVVKAEFSGNGYATKTITYEVTVKEAVVAAIEMGDSSDYTDTVSITLSNAGEYTLNFNVYAGGKKVATLNGGNITVIPRVENGTEIIGVLGVYSQGTTQTMYVKVTGVTGYEVRAELVTVVAGQKTSDMEAVDEAVEDTELDAEEVVEEQVESEDEDTEEVIEEVSEDSEVTEEVTETVEEEVPAEDAVEEIVEETAEAEVA